MKKDYYSELMYNPYHDGASPGNSLIHGEAKNYSGKTTKP